VPRPTLVRLPAWRLVAGPAAIDAARWSGDPVVLRSAPDEAIGIGATGVTTPASGAAADPHAIALPDAGLAGAWLDAAGLAQVVAHVEWHLPDARPALAQGKVAGVPAKVWLAAPGERRGLALLVVQAAHAHDLADRLGIADETLGVPA
jgi:hypothetical protein